MKLHREGTLIIIIALAISALLSFGNYFLSISFPSLCILWVILQLGIIVMLYLVIQFFRVPNRICISEDLDIICPADGKVVVIEEVMETEFFNEKRIQISIFMSPLNVHANYNPIKGIVKYVKYHKGLFLVAWHPKSSTDNERSTFVVEHPSGKSVLFRQIAGAVARRICYYAREGQTVAAGEEFGFIKFGSRIDLFLPLDSKINVKIDDIVKAKITKIGSL
jgi:phosphatidylserine decarboxylase